MQSKHNQQIFYDDLTFIIRSLKKIISLLSKMLANSKEPYSHEILSILEKWQIISSKYPNHVEVYASVHNRFASRMLEIITCYQANYNLSAKANTIRKHLQKISNCIQMLNTQHNFYNFIQKLIKIIHENINHNQSPKNQPIKLLSHKQNHEYQHHNIFQTILQTFNIFTSMDVEFQYFKSMFYQSKSNQFEMFESCMLRNKFIQQQINKYFKSHSKYLRKKIGKKIKQKQKQNHNLNSRESLLTPIKSSFVASNSGAKHQKINQAQLSSVDLIIKKSTNYKYKNNHILSQSTIKTIKSNKVYNIQTIINQIDQQSKVDIQHSNQLQNPNLKLNQINDSKLQPIQKNIKQVPQYKNKVSSFFSFGPKMKKIINNQFNMKSKKQLISQY